ncbi:hypothetical protein M3Y94_00479300 [Aphelenchoides besseyi]|nr:hypothetical protein M3Y94_00479300 [Aphelenchoides besseyi]
MILLIGIDFVSASNPCDGKIVVVLDASVDFATFDSNLFKNQNNFVKTLFSRPYFDSFERLALGSYDRGNTKLTKFGEFYDESDVTRFVDSVQQGQNFASMIEEALAAVYNQNYTSTKNEKITVIFFVSVIFDHSVMVARITTQKLEAQGIRVVFIAHSKQPSNIEQLNDVADDPETIFFWDSRKSLPAEDYENWFKWVVKCRPSEVIKTTEPPTSPCNGKIVVVMDSSMERDGFTKRQFIDQKHFVEKLLLSSSFDHYERLAIAYYSNSTIITELGDLRDMSEVGNYLNLIKQQNSLPFLTRALERVYDQNYLSNSQDKATAIVFVSDVEEYEIQKANLWAKKLYDQGVRLILVGHGNFKEGYVNINRLADITDHPNTAFEWADNRNVLTDDYETWFKQALNCPGYEN